MFEGHHRVGWNSYPNVMAILTGKAAYKPEEKPENGTLYIDEEFQFIQNTFQENGYLRLHLEDFAAWPNFFKPGPWSSNFNPLKIINFSGYFQFKKKPAEFYYRSAYLAMSKEGLLNCRFLASSACLQERMIHEHQFSFIRDFLQDYRNIPTFTYLHLNEILHDSLTLSKHSDQDFANLLGRDFLYILVVDSISSKSLIIPYYIITYYIPLELELRSYKAKL